MITLQNISKTYHHLGRELCALDNISLHVGRGTIYGIVGESGAGKSTLVRCINLLERPTSGSVIVDQQNITQLNAKQLVAARHQMGMIFQHFNLLASRTVFANVALPLELAGVKAAQIEARVLPLLQLTGLSDKRNFYPAQLSGGQKQRVAIARALSSNPKVLLCDEATSALDPKTTESILQLLKDINRQLGVTIVLITHEMEVVKAICEHVALLDAGKLVEVAAVADFFAMPQSALGKKFIAQSQNFELPEHIQAELNHDGSGHPLIKLAYFGSAVELPIISQLSRQFDIDVIIIQAKIEHVRSNNIGILVAALKGSPSATSAALDYLATLPLTLEVLGYVQPHA